MFSVSQRRLQIWPTWKLWCWAIINFPVRWWMMMQDPLRVLIFEFMYTAYIRIYIFMYTAYNGLAVPTAVLSHNQINMLSYYSLIYILYSQRLSFHTTLSGPMPRHWCPSVSGSPLSDLILGHNQLTGSLDLGRCNNLVYLDTAVSTMTLFIRKGLLG